MTSRHAALSSEVDDSKQDIVAGSKIVLTHRMFDDEDLWTYQYAAAVLPVMIIDLNELFVLHVQWYSLEMILIVHTLLVL